jgi:hypothetical protein
MRLLGVDPVTAFSLEQLAGDPGRGSGPQYQTGAYRIEEAVAFQLLVDIMASDPGLGRRFASEQETIAYISGKARLVGQERSDALRRSSSWFLFFDVFDPVTEAPARLNQVCRELTANLARS